MNLKREETRPGQNVACACQNLVFLRRKLMISQGEFITRYLVDDSGKKIVTTAKLSNIENGAADTDKEKIDKVINLLSARLSLNPASFYLSPDAFAKNLEGLWEDQDFQGGQVFKDISHLIKRKSYIDTVVHVISDYLIDLILRGELKPGDKLPSDRALSETLEISRSALREAMKVLNVMGLVNILHGQGTFIASKGSDFLTEPLSWAFLIGNKNLEDIIVVRNALEPLAVRYAAQNRAGGRDCTRLTVAFENLCNALDKRYFPEFVEADLEFHLAISELCGNNVITDLLRTIRRITKYVSSTGMVTIKQMDESFTEHKKIYDAIMAGDPEKAEKAMTAHLDNAKNRYKLPRA